MSHSFNPEINETIAAKAKWELEKATQHCSVIDADCIYIVDCVTAHVRLIGYQSGNLVTTPRSTFTMGELVSGIIHLVKKDSKGKLDAKQINKMGGILAMYATQTNNYQIWNEQKITPKLHMILNVYRKKNSSEGTLRPCVFIPKGRIATSDEIKSWSENLLEHDMVNNPSFLIDM